MSLSCFYSKEGFSDSEQIVLDEDNSRYIVQVLRMKEGDDLLLTDGKGNQAKGQIITANKRKCSIAVKSSQYFPRAHKAITIAISPLKNNTRFEWFLEKATEIGVSRIIPLMCTRTEKHQVRENRMKSILISAMLQSQQVWLPEFDAPTPFDKVCQLSGYQSTLIAHCDKHEKTPIASLDLKLSPVLILIGPEGDFTEHEIGLAQKNKFTEVSLGTTRLRTETAGIVAVTILAAGSPGSN